MAFTKLRRRPLDFVDERPEHDCSDISIDDCDISGDDSFIRTTLKSPTTAEEFWDSGFSSPPNNTRLCSMEDGSPVKVMDFQDTLSPPFSPPAIGGLRLFDTPHTPRTLLQKASISGSPEARVENRKISRLRRGGLGFGRQAKTDPKVQTKPRITANINPFTPDLNSGVNSNNKRTRKVR